MISDHAQKHLPSGAIWLGHWILFGAACNVAGWSLSAIHQLSAIGLVLTIPAAWLLMARLTGLGMPPLPSKNLAVRWRKRFSKPFPAAFLLLATLSLVGGFVYAPSNLDAMIYRMPRVCHWLMAERWEWIPTIKNNLNTRSAGFEWWTAPIFAIFKTDRLVFLINWVSFLFLPGLFFSLFRHMGVSRKASHAWMWILPTGYCFVLQAASVGNDMLAALFAVAAFDFGFRWKRSGAFPCFSLALVAAAMMTAIKPTTLPLLLPFAVLFFGMWKSVLAKPLTTVVLVILFALSSFLPTAVINIRQCGDWTGAAAEDSKLGRVEPLVGITTNTINTLIQNTVPPVFPVARQWNHLFVSLFPAAYIAANHRSFETNGAQFAVPDFQGEELSGIGMGLTFLLVTSLILGWRLGPTSPLPAEIMRHRRRFWMIASVAFGLALAAYFSRAGMTTVARHIAPFYPFLFALCLFGRVQATVVSSRWWRWAAVFAVTSSLVMVIIVPSRPLWPSTSLLARVDANSPKILQRAKSGYEVYSGRSDGLGPLRDALPADANIVGFLNHSTSPELPLWKPYMTRVVRHVLPNETIRSLQEEGLRYLILNTENFEAIRNINPEKWVEKDGGIIRQRISLQLMAKFAPSEWWVIEIPPRNP
jgi:hypothetical protein